MPRRRFAARHLGVAALLGGTAALYLWGLSASGWANAFYAAAAQAGAQDWTAWFFGSSDAANAITVDKTPAALWVTGLSVRLFGLSSWSILVPQALMGVATVGLLYATVRRTAGTAAGLLAGAAMALTPVAVLMFRFNNPDALLTLLLVGAAYAVLRGVAAGRTGWLVLAATLIGFGFLTKMLQAFLVVPVFAAVWLLAAPTGLHRRLRDLVLACVALLVGAGWWVLAVELWPVGSRPYIGGSQANSVLELVFGYNGFGRITGDEIGSVGGGFGGGWGRTGLTRLFDGALGGEIAWLLPAALVLLGVLLWRCRRADRADRSDPLRAATILWGGWLLLTGLVFSLMAGIFHGYYLVVLAPAIAALVGMGATVLWRARAALPARIALTATFALTVVWAFALLTRTVQWNAWLGWTVLAAGAALTLPLLGVHRAPRVVAAGIATAVTATVLAGPAAYALDTAATPHTGAVPVAGPQTESRRGGVVLIGPGPGGSPQGRPPGAPRSGGGFMRGGGLLDSPTPSAEVTALLQQDADAFTWAAAAVGSNNAAGYQLAAGAPVMAVGGFNGTDPAPTLEQFQQLVAQGKVHWFVGGRGPGSTESGGSDAARQIADWVAATFPPTTVGSTVLYDLSGAS
nr:glycosyltransferase family 39 protein [Pseudonocardia sp. TRM90224]